MYKELVMLKNNRGSWDYILNIGLTELVHIHNNQDAINLVTFDLSPMHIHEFVVTENEIYVITNTKIICRNCGDIK